MGTTLPPSLTARIVRGGRFVVFAIVPEDDRGASRFIPADHPLLPTLRA
jgi:hypothetical protein